MILFFADYIDFDKDKELIDRLLKPLGVKYKVTEDPEDLMRLSAYSDVFLDFGGLVYIPGHMTIFESYARNLENLVNNNPSINFYVTSIIGMSYYKDVMERIEYPNLRFISHINKDILQYL